jgi:hypothetical protein
MRFTFQDATAERHPGQFHQPNVNSWLTRSIEIELIEGLSNFLRER